MIRLFSYLSVAIAETNVREISYYGGVIGIFIIGLMGGLDDFLKALIIFMVIDYLTGVLVAWQRKKLSSEVGFEGLRKKGTIVLLVILGSVVDTYILQKGQVVRTAVIFTYLSNEGISILENCSNLGLPIPKKLKSVLEQLNDTDSDIDSDEEKKTVKENNNDDETEEIEEDEDK